MGLGDGRAAALLSPDARDAADGLLGELLQHALAEDDALGPATQRFKGAVRLLGAAGIVEPAAWDERERSLRGWPSAEDELELERKLNVGGSQVDLRQVSAGPEERRGGRRLLYVLVFDDGVSCLVERKERDLDLDDWPRWRLSDDTGTSYALAGAGSGDNQQRIDFRQAPPAEATWLELTLADDAAVTFRVPL